MTKHFYITTTIMLLIIAISTVFVAGFVVGSMNAEPQYTTSVSIPVYQPIVKSYDTLVLEFANYYGIVDDHKIDVMQMISEEADRQGVDRALSLSVAFIESSFDNSARSRAGAVGVMQLMPIWGDDIHHLDVNIRKGIALLKERLDFYDGDEYRTLKYYNGGWKAFHAKYPRVQKKTSRYARKVMHVRDKLLAGG